METTATTRQVHRNADACATHAGTMVLALTAWAREHHLASAQLKVLAIGPLAFPALAADNAGGFAFTIIPIST